MSLPSTERGQSRKSFQMKVVMVVLAVILGWVLLEYSSLLYKTYQIELKKQWFMEENDRLTGTNKELEKKYEYYQTDYFFRKEAKRKLNKKEPGESVIVVTGGDEEPVPLEGWEYREDVLREWWEYLFASKEPEFTD